MDGATVVRPRRSHPKSRTGCRTCKGRKIKCDERRPSCRNCTKHGVKCDFLAQEGFSKSLAGDGPSNGLNAPDLELMHNFSTSTYMTLSRDFQLRDMWKVSAVQIALNCDYVLRCILAVSALHLAHHRPDRRDYYTSEALLHHQIASRAAMAEISNVTRENVEYLHLFSILTIYFALGSPRRPDGFLLLGESSFPDWMFLISGTRHFTEFMREDLFNGPLGPILRHGKERSLVLYPTDHGQQPQQATTPAIEALNRLRALIEGSVANEDVRGVYLFAIHALYPHYKVFLSGDSPDGPRPPAVDMTDVFVWIYFVADDFVPFLKVPTQEAVAIFAHLCVLLHRVEYQWWIQGWAEHLISKTYSLLDDEHRLWIRWPIEEMGWLPPSATTTLRQDQNTDQFASPSGSR